MRRQFVVFLLLAPLLVPVAHAKDDDDSKRARAALEAGEIRPLSELLAGVEARYAGHVIDTELEQEHGRWIYEFRFLPEAGHIFAVKVDAATGKVVGTRGPVREKP